MVTHWYYVEDNERVGPIGEPEFSKLIDSGKVDDNTYVWKKGFENWILLKYVEDPIGDGEKIESFSEPAEAITEEPLSQESNEVESTPFEWVSTQRDAKIFTIRVGKDRGNSKEQSYGPFSIEMLEKLKSENRVCEKTLVFAPGMTEFISLGETPIYNQGDDVAIDNRREHDRAPLVARLFFHNDAEFFEGVCRDISIGGMQVLVSGFRCQVGDAIKINVHPLNSNLQFVADGTVVRVLSDCEGICVRFSKMSPDNLQKITQYIEEFEVG